ncbi:hypothetical protein BHM03_00058557 [Ensete ventricosum]|nr:hypothetical protein BHM03_00058557 [Ensete ventricosum]
MSFYNECYRSFVPEIFIASMAYNAVVLLHTVRGPCSEAHALPAAAVACRPYPCQRRISLKDRPDRVGAREMNWSGLSTRKLIRPSWGSRNEPVRFKYPKADPTELGLEKWTSQVGMTSSDSSSSIRIVPSPGSGGTGLGEPEASSSGASLGPPSPVDARVLKDLEVMKAAHDLDTRVTEGSLAIIRERYSIPTESNGSQGSAWNAEDIGGKTPLVRAAVPTQEISISPAREASMTSSKRLTDASTERIDDLARRHKKVKILSRRHKSRHGKGGSRSHSKGKEPIVPVEEP